MSERIRTRPYVWQPVSWAEGRVLTRGSVDGLPALSWGRAGRGELATARQLRGLGLRPAGAEPVAVLVFGHRQPGRRPVEYTSLYRIADAAPKRTATAAQQAAIDKALTARRTCQDCGQEQDYYLSTVERRCGPCSDATGFWDDYDGRAAEHDDHDDGAEHDDGAVHAVHADRGAVGSEAGGWWVEHEAAVRAEDPHRPVTETDLADDDLAESHDPAEVGLAAAVPAPRTAAPDTPAPAPTAADTADDAHEVVPAPVADETARAVGQARHALQRIAQGGAAIQPRVTDQGRAERLVRWHGDDQASDRAADRAAGAHRELEGIAR
ncbi:MAG: hypothetical protein GEV09_04650 [Pseudonocardiaceae bacterium]|nr:hypothetical protein [Pseudonocardiaceae bacterium]